MSKIVFSVILFIGHFYSQANSSCPGVWDLKHKGQLSPQSVKEMFEKFYVEEERIVPDINISEVEMSGGAIPHTHIVRNKRTITDGIETYELEVLPKPASLIEKKYNRHENSQFYKVAKWRGEKVFLKQITQPNGERELAILRTLSEIGIPVLFKGVVRNTDGSLYMVSSFQESPVFKSLEAAFKSFDVKYHTDILQQLKHIYSLFLEYGVSDKDFQFMVSAEGKVYVVDVEFYTFLGHKIEKS